MPTTFDDTALTAGTPTVVGRGTYVQSILNGRNDTVTQAIADKTATVGFTKPGANKVPRRTIRRGRPSWIAHRNARS